MSMPTAGKRQHTLLLGLGLLLLVLTFTSALPAYVPRSVQQLWQLGHTLLFAVWTLLLYPRLAANERPALYSAMLLLGFSLGAGALIEYLQRFIGRDFSLRDLAFDLIGCLLGLCYLAARGQLKLKAGLKCLGYGLALMLSLYALTPLVTALLDEFRMYRDFPRLAGFEQGLERQRWQGNVEILRLLSAEGDQQVLAAQLDTGRYSGLTLLHFPGDWRGYRQLHLALYNPGQGILPLTLRIHDVGHFSAGKGAYSDRFNRNLRLQPGWNDIDVDLEDIATAAQGRRLDLARIQALGLFATALPTPRMLYLDNLELRK